VRYLFYWRSLIFHSFVVSLVGSSFQGQERVLINFIPAAKSAMFGTGHGFLYVLLFSSRQYEMNLTDPSFLGMTKVGAAHHERFTFFMQ